MGSLGGGGGGWLAVEFEGDLEKGWLPIIFIPVNGFGTSGVQQQTI